MDYQAIKDLAKAEGLKVTDLLALAPQNDPYYTGAPATVQQAEWFAELWERFGFSEGVHLRRVHYQLVSQHGPTMADGSPYQNTEACWSYLCNAGKYARYMGLVPATAFVDRRNPDPHLFAVGVPNWGHEPEARVWLSDYNVPVIPTDLGELDWSLPTPSVDGYAYDVRDQAYHLELWIEKSTMDDVLLPIGQELGVNICTSLGFQSITSVIAMLTRIAERGKPARIFYVSDFDPAGDGMPTAVARQIQFWCEQIAPDCEIALVPIALTKAQVQEYRLPTIPVKDSDLRKANFAARYGEDGAVELDALEALYPGKLAEIVRQHIRPYIDRRLSSKLWRAESEARQVANDEWHELTEDEARDLEAVRNEAAEIIRRYDSRLIELSEAMAADLADVKERLAAVSARIRTHAEEFAPDLPERPEPDPDGDVIPEYAWLYRSDRDYLAQNEVYKSRKAGTMQD